MSARSKLRRLRLENSLLQEAVTASVNIKELLYNKLFPGEQAVDREVRWKWILLKLDDVLRENARMRAQQAEKETTCPSN